VDRKSYSPSATIAQVPVAGITYRGSQVRSLYGAPTFLPDRHSAVATNNSGTPLGACREGVNADYVGGERDFLERRATEWYSNDNTFLDGAGKWAISLRPRPAADGLM
jgi:hypothetical protein